MKLRIILAFLLIFLNFKAYAIMEIQKISIDEAIDIASKTNPQIKIADIDVQIKKNDIKIANRLQNPSIGAFQNMGTGGRGEPQQIGVDYIIEILKRGKRKSAALKDSWASYDNQKYAQYMLTLAVKKAYFDFLLKKSNLKLVKEQLDLSNELYQNIEKESKKGNIPKTDVIQAKIAHNRSIMYYNIAKSELIYSQNRFNSVMNSNNINYDTKEDELDEGYETLLTINPNDNIPSFEKIKDYTLSNRYDFIALEHKVESAKDKLKVAKSNRIPDLELTGGYQYRPRGGSDSNHLESGSYIGASFTNIPIFYNYKPEIENAKLEIEKAKLQYEDLKIDIIRDITDAYEKYTIAKDNLNFYNKELLNNSNELIEISYQNLNKKQIDISEFLISKKLYLELMLGYKEALREYYDSYAELLATMNIDKLVENI